tara:strand:+ start:2297 stop:4138 length:1842 start_codon:yes stop_codon:yes gene_type:complete
MKNKKEMYFDLQMAQGGNETNDERDRYEYYFDEETQKWYSKPKGSSDEAYEQLSEEKANKLFNLPADTVNPALNAADNVIDGVQDLNDNVGVSSSAMSSIVDDSRGQYGLRLNQANRRTLESSRRFAGVGDTNILDVFGAVDATIKDLKPGEENYYDTKASDYVKYNYKNKTGEDVYIDQDAFNKGKKQSDVFGLTKDEVVESEMQGFLDERYKSNPSKYAKVKNFNIKDYEEGNVDYRQGPFNLFKSEGKEGDLLEQRDNADQIVYSTNKKGKYVDPVGFTKGQNTDGTYKQFDIYEDPNATPTLQTKPLEQIEYQLGGGKDFSGYNPLTNQYTNPFLSSNVESGIDLSAYTNLSTAPEESDSFFNSNDRLYAMQSGVNRSMDSYEAATKKTMDEFNNPLLNQTSLDLPTSNTFEPSGNDEFINDLNVSKDFRTQDTADIDVDELDSRKDKRALRKYRRDLEKESNEGQDSFTNRSYNKLKQLSDSKPVQLYGKIGAGAVRIAKPVNRMLEQREERERKDTMMKNAFLSDNMYASRDADLSGSKGDYDVNTGIFRAEDKLPTIRQGKYGAELSSYLTFAKNGGSFFNEGNEAEIDANMYKELIAAGADLEIL